MLSGAIKIDRSLWWIPVRYGTLPFIFTQSHNFITNHFRPKSWVFGHGAVWKCTLSFASRKHFPWTTSSSLSSTIIVPFSLFRIICIWWYCPSSTRWEYFKTTGPPPTSNCNFGRPSSCKRVFSITDRFGGFQILIRKKNRILEKVCPYVLASKISSRLEPPTPYVRRWLCNA